MSFGSLSHPSSLASLSLLFSPQSHRRQHNKDKPYKCHNCNRGYTDAASLEVHLSTHTVKHAKLFSCGLCNRSYTSVSAQTCQSKTRQRVYLTSNSNRCIRTELAACRIFIGNICRMHYLGCIQLD